MRPEARKVLGRRFDELLNGARPARAVERAAIPTIPSPAGPPKPAPGLPLQPDLPLPPAPRAPGAPAAAQQPVPTSRPNVRLFRIGYQMAPPPAAPSSSAFVVLVFADALLLGAAAVLVFTSLVTRPLSLILAGSAVGLGGILACAGMAARAARRRARAADAGTSRIRVQITRV